MADERNRRDANRVTTISGVSSVDNDSVVLVRVNPTTGRLLIDNKSLVPDEDFDHITIANSDTDEDTLTYKSGGSGGSTVRTLVVGYAAGAEKISDSLATLDYS